MNTSVGAISFDVTTPVSIYRMIKDYQGNYRISWNKFFDLTDTSLNIAAYRYTQDYLGLNDALTLIDEVEHPTQDLDPKAKNYLAAHEKPVHRKH